MSEPKWEDVEVGDAIIANHWGNSDVTISGTVVGAEGGTSGSFRGYYLSGMTFPLGSKADTWTLLDIIKPGPSLPTAIGSVVRYELDGPGDYAHYMLQGIAFNKKSWSGPCGSEYTEGDMADIETPWELVYDAGKTR